MDVTKVTRVEVIDERGRILTIRPNSIELQLQDDGRTLKIFAKGTSKRNLNDAKGGMKL